MMIKCLRKDAMGKTWLCIFVWWKDVLCSDSTYCHCLPVGSCVKMILVLRCFALVFHLLNGLSQLSTNLVLQQMYCKRNFIPHPRPWPMPYTMWPSHSKVIDMSLTLTKISVIALTGRIIFRATTPSTYAPPFGPILSHRLTRANLYQTDVVTLLPCSQVTVTLNSCFHVQVTWHSCSPVITMR